MAPSCGSCIESTKAFSLIILNHKTPVLTSFLNSRQVSTTFRYAHAHLRFNSDFFSEWKMDSLLDSHLQLVPPLLVESPQYISNTEKNEGNAKKSLLR